jgi:hypothetical protein
MLKLLVLTGNTSENEIIDLVRPAFKIKCKLTISWADGFDFTYKNSLIMFVIALIRVGSC